MTTERCELDSALKHHKFGLSLKLPRRRLLDNFEHTSSGTQSLLLSITIKCALSLLSPHPCYHLLPHPYCHRSSLVQSRSNQHYQKQGSQPSDLRLWKEMQYSSVMEAAGWVTSTSSLSPISLMTTFSTRHGVFSLVSIRPIYPTHSCPLSTYRRTTHQSVFFDGKDIY